MRTDEGGASPVPPGHAAAAASAPDRAVVQTSVLIPVGEGGTPATFHSFGNLGGHEEHFAVQFGDGVGTDGAHSAPLVRVHSECITGDLFGSHRCDCGPQLREALARLQQEGGYLVYLRQEGRGIGLYNKLAAYILQDQGFDTFEANRHLNHPDDSRDYRPAAAMLRALGVGRARLLTNNPHKVENLREHGMEITEVIPTGVFTTAFNLRYLRDKASRKHHTIHLDLTVMEGAGE